MSEFILVLTPTAQKFKDDVLSEMRRRFPDHLFTADSSWEESGNRVIPIQGTVGSLEEPGYLRPVSKALRRQVDAEFAMVLKAAKARTLQ